MVAGADDVVVEDATVEAVDEVAVEVSEEAKVEAMEKAEKILSKYKNNEHKNLYFIFN